ncbi:SDR family NAD(P)-dependent oxidoreductase [Carboxydochorda subterranea]|uniref:SDR family NAD(P)-dependent oxidoreductase n=1 Tax=Carboxydichorda subterranea TaxID=3109565 RepID=A0ABZ1BXN8_9FIRM|nr:SDR family NAD(P)-dependent oxidoreductase [Limnochorda sp. L945t]WRP17270.1 SDR family NAD(P)-dependent oxidoreductase [Limnochorda sp. L945t]
MAAEQGGGALRGKVALITGASRGIGRSVAIRLAREGVHAALFARTEPDLRAVAGAVQAQGARALVLPGDGRRVEDVQRAIAATIETLGGFDILVINAGVGKYGPLEAFSPDDYDWIMETNMRSTFLFARFAVPHLKRQGSGHVVIVASVAGKKGLPNEAVYCASKHAQVGFAQALDYELRPHGVKVTTIAPGGVHTHFALGTGRTPGDPQLEEYLDPEDVAEAVYFAVAQPPKSRIIEVVMRPMREPL